MASTKAVIGIVATQPQAEIFVVELQRSGFRTDDISVVFPDAGATQASAGMVPGLTLGVLAGVGALAIPGVGRFIAAGPLMAALSGVGGGAPVVGVTGALVGLGMPEVQAEAYEAMLKSGNILVSVHADDADMRTRARGIMERNSATDVATVEEESVAALSL
jgi:hypothetical protein